MITPEMEPVLLDIQGNGVATLTLNRPKAMNALNEELVGVLEDKFYQVENDPAVKAIALCGAGKQFVAGADIKFFINNIKAEKISDILSFTRRTSELFLAIETSKKPTIAVLDGFSLGGGSELALACQAIIATPKGSLGFPETAIGIYPGLGGMLRLARKIGPALAKYYVFTGTTISSQEAFDLGLFEKIVPAEQLDTEIENLVVSGVDKTGRISSLSEKQKEMERLFSGDDLMVKFEVIKDREFGETFTEQVLKMMETKAPLALKIANEIIDQQVGKPFREAMEIELGRIVEMFSTKDALEGLSSLGKRKPNFKNE